MSLAKPIRFHHLDALRAFAMLLGIVLHALLSFIDIPFWPAQDITRGAPAYSWLQHAIHGFRMPLFFLISGFFTAMLWQRRGLKKLIVHRFQRIFLPLVAGWIVLVPMIIVVGAIGGAAKSSAPKQSGSPPQAILAAARAGDAEQFDQLLADGADINARDEAKLAPLAWSALHGDAGAVGLLLDHGAEIDVRDDNQATPLHCAAFLGRSEVVELLVERGADLTVRTKDGDTPLDSARSDWGTVEYIVGLLRMEVDKTKITAGRTEVVPYLVSMGVKSKGELAGTNPILEGIVGVYQFFAMFPIFHHLWFLYYLLWLVAGFALAALIVKRLGLKPLPPWLIASPWCWLWLIPLTIIPQFFMRQGFGPDTAVGILPWPPKLIYYAVFFGFGALCFGREELESRAGRWWPLCFASSIPLLIFGIHSFESGTSPLLTSLCAASYAWLMIYGCTGFFRQFFANPSPKIRYVSDASYWIYLAHLPLVMALQILIMQWQLPSLAKIVGLCVVTYAILLILYEYAVRYTPVGTLLNGKKFRIAKPPPLPTERS